MDARAVITQFAPALARVVASYERDRALQEELLQEVLMAILSSLPRLAHADKLKPFVFRIAHNRCLSHVAKRMRERAHQETLDDLAAEAATQAQAPTEQQRGARFLEAVRRPTLPTRQAMNLTLEDTSYDE